MGQAAGGVLQGGGAVPMGYQPSETAQMQAAACQPSKFKEDDYWSAPKPQVSSAGQGATGSYDSRPSPADSHRHSEPQNHLRFADRLASFNTDIDAACDRADMDYRQSGSLGNGVGTGAGSAHGTGMNVGNGFGTGMGSSMGTGMAGGYNSSDTGYRADSHGSPYPMASASQQSYGGGGGDYSSSASCPNRNGSGFGGGAPYSSSAAGGRPLPASSAFSSYSSMAGPAQTEGLARRREEWEVGSVVEVFSASTGRWYAARVMSIQPQDGKDVVTAQFSTDDGLKMKSTYREDNAFEMFGIHLCGELPPGFQQRPSQSRPGQVVYYDATTAMKYASAELAWRVHLERLINQPAVGMQTVGVVPGTGAVAPSPFSSVTSSAAAPMPTQMHPSTHGSPPVMSLADLQGSGQRLACGPGHGMPALEPVIEDMSVDGKVALPSFGDARAGGQAAYLGYMGSPGFAAPIDEEDAVYRTPQGARVPPAQRPVPTRVVNPAIAQWQDDPFSQWRG